MRGILTVLILTFTFLNYAQEVELKTNKGTLKGSLLTPTEGEKWPIVLIIPGSGPTDRDGNNPQLKNDALKLLAEALQENGYASLRYDKRGVAGSSDAMIEEEAMRFNQFVDDAADWGLWIRKDGRFGNIIGLGHSQGALVALLAATTKGSFDGYISLCGPSEPINEILKTQLKPQIVSDSLEQIIFAKIDSLKQGYHVKDNVPQAYQSLLRQPIQSFLMSWMQYTPSQELAKLNIPALIVGGSTDMQVPGEQAKLMGKLNDNAKGIVIKDMNHVLRYTKEDNIMSQMETYADASLPLHPKLMKPILKYLEQFKLNN